MQTVRTVLAVIGGIVAWIVVATLGNFVLRAALPGYVAVEKSMDFTLAMLWARLVLGAISTIAAGFVVAWLTSGRSVPTRAFAIVLLLCFVVMHLQIWHKFPVWYHLLFLGSLVPLALWGAALSGKLGPRRNALVDGVEAGR